ncbi:MAG: HAD family hydrolase [Deltaproteobacteria bacterium]|nr:HAD family hydrolase [Deltaproteobacteria bacterium]
MAAIRMLALDIDGTLAVRGDEVSVATRDALHGAHARGIEIVIATGRRYRTTRRVIEALGLGVPAICLGGALVKAHDHTTLHAQAFAPQDFRLLADALREAGLTLVGQRDSHAAGGADFVVDDVTPGNEAIERYLATNANHWERCDVGVHASRDDVLVIGTFGELGPLESMTARLSETHGHRFSSHIVPTPWDGSFYLEIVSAHVSKWSGLLTLGDRLGISREEICAVGDERNDIPMVRGSGLGVAMANGNDALKAAADWVCGRNDEDGLVEVVDHILGRCARMTRSST